MPRQPRIYLPGVPSHVIQRGNNRSVTFFSDDDDHRYYQRHDVILIRQIRSLLYEQGFTIGGARQRLSGDEAKEDSNQSQQIIRQLRNELEEVLDILRR